MSRLENEVTAGCGPDSAATPPAQRILASPATKAMTHFDVVADVDARQFLVTVASVTVPFHRLVRNTSARILFERPPLGASR